MNLQAWGQSALLCREQMTSTPRARRERAERMLKVALAALLGQDDDRNVTAADVDELRIEQRQIVVDGARLVLPTVEFDGLVFARICGDLRVVYRAGELDVPGQGRLQLWAPVATVVEDGVTLGEALRRLRRRCGVTE